VPNSSDDAFVVAELHGRLGNQLFQFASAFGIARTRGARLVFAVGDVASSDLLLPALIPELYRTASPRELLAIGHFEYNVPGRAVARPLWYRLKATQRRLRGRTPPSITYWENTGRYRPALAALDLPVYLQGHLQSERYFADRAAEIVAAIRWPAGTTQKLPHVSSRPTVGVSFRRGEYLELGWALPLAYYEEALAGLTARVDNPTLVLFGDDPAFVQLAADRIARFGRVVNAVDRAPDAFSQLRLLAACDHCVIANSSFAWWGAWLGDQRVLVTGRDRIVIAPKEYGDGGDRLPSRWETVVSGTLAF
jgi:hypothetical protein